MLDAFRIYNFGLDRTKLIILFSSMYGLFEIFTLLSLVKLEKSTYNFSLFCYYGGKTLAIDNVCTFMKIFKNLLKIWLEKHENSRSSSYTC